LSQYGGVRTRRGHSAGHRAPRSDGPVGTRCTHELSRMYHAAFASSSSAHIGGCCRFVAS
jgi:hypothetical protein